MKKYTFMIAFSPDRLIPFDIWSLSLVAALNIFHYYFPHFTPEDTYSVDGEVCNLRHSTL